MKFKIKASDLGKLFSNASLIEPSKILDITRFSLVTIQDGLLRLQTGNTAISLTQHLEIEASGQIEALLPTSQLKEILATFSGTVEMNIGKGKITFSQGMTNITKSIRDDIENWLTIPEFQDFENETFDIEIFRNAISSVLYAASDDNSRPILQSVCWNSGMYSTDGFRMAYSNITSKNSITVPSDSLVKLIGVLPKEGAISVQKNNNNNDNLVLFRFNSSVFACTLSSGQYPDISSFIGNKLYAGCKVRVNKLSERLKQAAVIVKENLGDLIEISIAENGLIIDADNPNGDKYSSLVDISEYQGIAVKFAINCTYLSTALAKTDNEYIYIGTLAEGHQSPVVIKDGEDFEHVIIPMHRGGR